MYAIVDIETTGGYARANGITEIAIILHDGKQITEKFQTLVNPQAFIPNFIQSLTGIDNDMVDSAPLFGQIASTVFNLLHDKIFVAHNVNFDYSFIRHNLMACGFDLQVKKLCTVRLARKILPGYSSYGLGKICKCLGICIEDRHRAMGDAEATAKLLDIIIARDNENHISASLKKSSKEHILPPNLSKSQLEDIPSSPGVYYFNNSKGKAVYIGKAKNLKKRILSHFTGNNSGSQRQGFLKDIHSITFEKCGTELITLILEAIEIKRLWPQYNRSMKRFEQLYGLFTYEDQNGFYRICIDKKLKFTSPVLSFGTIAEGYNLIRRLVSQFNLCYKLGGIEKSLTQCSNAECKYCKCAEAADEYNLRVKAAIETLKAQLPSFAVVDDGITEEEKSCILIDGGKLYGMGYLPNDFLINDCDILKNLLKPYPSNDYLKNLIFKYANNNPGKLYRYDSV